MSTEIIWKCCGFDELKLPDLYRILQLRAEVFVVEQNCAYQDVDGFDQQAFHVMAFQNSAGKEPELVCYSRLLPPAAKYPTTSIGRVISKSTVRGDGYGKILMNQSIDFCREHWPNKDITISAQQYLQKFYTELGFATESEPYDEDGIPHIRMRFSF